MQAYEKIKRSRGEQCVHTYLSPPDPGQRPDSTRRDKIGWECVRRLWPERGSILLDLLSSSMLRPSFDTNSVCVDGDHSQVVLKE